MHISIGYVGCMDNSQSLFHPTHPTTVTQQCCVGSFGGDATEGEADLAVQGGDYTWQLKAATTHTVHTKLLR